MSLRERVRKAWQEANVPQIVDELMEKASILTDLSERPQGSVDAVLVYDTETDELCTVKESKNTFTPSFVYLYRLSANDKPDVNDDLYLDLIERVPEAIGMIEE